MAPPCLYIVGNGAHGKDLRDSFHNMPVYMLDDDPEWSADWPNGGSFLVGINNPCTRRKVAERLQATGRWHAYHCGRWVARSAVLSHSVYLGHHVHVNIGASLVRCTLGDYTTVAPGVTVCGDVKLGEEVFVGAGATICNLVTIGDGAVIGAGAVVLPGTSVPAGETWVGVPARPL